MIDHLSSLSQRNLAVGLLISVISCLVLTAVWPIWSANNAYQARIDTVVSELSRLRSHAAADKQLRPRLEQLRKSQLADGYYLKSGTEAVAAAELQRIIKEITGRNGTQILSTQILPAVSEQDFTRVALRVRARGRLTGIIESVYEIESYRTFLFLDNVSIRHSARGGTTLQGVSNQFDSEFDLIGYMPGQQNEA
jgi:general secretion pathway protein M